MPMSTLKPFQRLLAILPRVNLNFARYQSVTTSEHGKKLAGRVAVVTGSTEGIGLSIAKRLAEDGAKVVISSRKQNNVDKAVQLLNDSFPGKIAGTVCHVGNDNDQKNLVDFSLKQFGAIDILVSNVAVNPYFGNFIDTQESQWDKIFDINVKAPFMLTQKVVPHMLNNKRSSGDNGAIVYISSITGYNSMNMIGAYSVSKTALLGLCKTMSMELALDRIRVNLVAPGVIKTKFSEKLMDSSDEAYIPLTHMKRLGEPHEIGGIVTFLCGPDASYITGENIVVSGGYHCAI